MTVILLTQHYKVRVSLVFGRFLYLLIHTLPSYESHPLTFSENSQKPRASKRREATESTAPYARKRSWDTLSKDHEDLPSDSRSSDFSVDKWGQPANWPRCWRPKVVRGIPEWALAKNYIQYRKCKYIEDIRYVYNVFLKKYDDHSYTCFFSQGLSGHS